MQRTHVMSLMPATLPHANGFKRREAATVGCIPDIRCEKQICERLLNEPRTQRDKLP